MMQDSEHDALENDRSNDGTTQDDLVETTTTQDEPVGTKTITETIADNGSKPEDDLYTAVSIEEDIDRLSNRWILDPGSNTYVINTKD
jgi:hypothetical protein